MCKCTPSKRTPFCGKLGCEWPKPNPKSGEPTPRDRRSFRSGYSDGRLAGLSERGGIVTKWVLGFDDVWGRVL